MNIYFNEYSNNELYIYQFEKQPISEIFRHIFFQPTEYFTPIGTVTIPINIEIFSMRFLDINNNEILSYSGNEDLYEKGLIFDRDDINMAISYYIEPYYKKIHQCYFKDQLKLIPETVKCNNNHSENDWLKIVENNRNLFLKFLQIPFVPNPEINKLVKSFNYTYSVW
jgi:hypothetical protein